MILPPIQPIHNALVYTFIHTQTICPIYVKEAKTKERKPGYICFGFVGVDFMWFDDNLCLYK